MTDADKEDVIIDNCADMMEGSCTLVALAKEKQTNVEQVVYVNNEGEDECVSVYDFKYYTWKSTDTFDKLARDFFGDANYGTMIAYYNGIKNESDMEAGSKIKIPILEESESMMRNKIYAAPDKQENYGIDIKLDSDGNFAVMGNDIGRIEGKDNLVQSIMMRLTTAIRQRIRLSSYGIRNAIGDVMALQSYLVSSIEQTVLSDPRIKSIESLSFKGEGDALYIDIAWIDINGDDGSFEGTLS